MTYAREMPRTSPNRPPVDEGHRSLLAEAIDALFDCAEACRRCEDACRRLLGSLEPPKLG